MAINSRINPSPRTLITEGAAALPIMWGTDHGSVEGGVVLGDTGVSAGSDGRKLIRAGSILVPDGSTNRYKLALTVADIAGDPDEEPPVAGPDSVVILKHTADLSGGAGLVGAFYRGGFVGTRMPSLADNAVAGLETAAKDALRGRGFVFGEDFGAR